ncbi:MAG TPA: hypothetical protein VG273_23570 [Bryobacteraceae bacterium]|nr:hypothetical protein [Bryobacteraceae bacterium]
MKIPLCLTILVALTRFGSAAVSATDTTIEFENAFVRVARVHYAPHEKTAVHDHPATPNVFVYVTDGGRLAIGHEGEEMVTRPPVKAGGIRYQAGVAERHAVEELDGVDSQYIRIELKTKPVDLPKQDVRRAPADKTPYESGMLNILRVTCPAQSACPASQHPEYPAVVVTGKTFVWVPAGAPPLKNSSSAPAEQVRVEIKTQPLP